MNYMIYQSYAEIKIPRLLNNDLLAYTDIQSDLTVRTVPSEV